MRYRIVEVDGTYLLERKTVIPFYWVVEDRTHDELEALNWLVDRETQEEVNHV